MGVPSLFQIPNVIAPSSLQKPAWSASGAPPTGQAMRQWWQ